MRERDDGGIGIPMAEFITLTAFMMALTAFSVDIMLPLLPEIVNDFELTDDNHQQFMVTLYLFSFAVGQIFVGPISDRVGRKPVLLVGLLIYLVGAVLSIFAESYTALLLARAIQGIGAAGPRVVAVAIVRDRFVGRAMSQVMSFVLTVFIILPVIAPSVGALIGEFGTWRHVFGFLLLFGLITACWTFVRLPETNPRRGENVRPPVPVKAALATIVGSAQTVGYMVALGFVFGCLMTYVSTTQQVFEDIYGIVDWFPIVFGAVAAMMCVSSVVNAQLVLRLGMRRLSHLGALGLAVVSALAALSSFIVDPLPLPVLMGFLGLSFFLMGLILPNFNALAMEPLGHIAGTGSSFIGFVMTGLGAILGGIAGQFYHGSLDALLVAFVVYSFAVVGIVLVVERGEIMRPSPRSVDG
ncbi:MAG: multidrug effflux MFS transporter [Pseudomonadota bacterium]